MIRRRALFAVFTISGFSGLIYESIWSHYLKLFLGHAAYAQTLVLAIFMGGMALGAWLIARSAGKIRNLLLAYAVVELLTGVIALLFHKLYTGTVAFSFDSVIPSMDSAAAIAGFKWTVAALLILPQSILLGTTFPLISGGVIRRFPDKPGETLAVLYFTNSLGAALGVLASGFWLVSAVGLPGTMMTAGLMNLLLALAVWALARREPEPAVVEPRVDQPVGAIAYGVLAAAFLAGLAAFIYEIAWIRMLCLVLGSSTHSFELMLSAFILGLALGGFLIRRRIGAIADPPRALAMMFSVMAVLGMLTVPAYGYAFDVMAVAMNTLMPNDAGYVAFNLLSHGIAAAIMIPTTVVAGMTLPLLTHYLWKSGGGEAAIGNVYAANTIGAIVGVLLAIHLLLPGVGTRGAVITAALLQAGISILFIARGERARGPLVTSAACVLVVMGIAIGARPDPLRLVSGVYRNGQASLPPDTRVIYLHDGKTATVSLARHGDSIAIATNGKTDAAINMGTGPADPDEVTMVLAAALPLAIHPDPKRVANIGIGSGLTSHVLLASTDVEVLDSIEIEPAIAHAARVGFERRVSRLFNDPRSHIHYEDAKTFFATTRRPYDLIVSEPSNPWVSGVASLFSEEFYAHIKRYLAKGGLLVQWVQVYETDITVLASIVKALSAHFPNYTIYNTDDTNLLIVASADGLVPSARADILRGALGKELWTVGVRSISDLEMRRVGDAGQLQALFESYPVPRNSDFFPFVDLTAPRMRFLRRSAQLFSQIKEHPVPVLELMGAPSLSTSPTRTEGPAFLRRQQLTQTALDIRAAFAGGGLRNLPMRVASELLVAGSEEASCSRDGASDNWYAAVRSLADRTNPYLRADDLKPIWNFIRSNPCFAHLSDAQRDYLAFVGALAERDRAAIVDRGMKIVRSTEALDEDIRIQLLIAIIASLIGGQDHAALSRLIEDERVFLLSHALDDPALRLVESAAFQRLARLSGNR